MTGDRIIGERIDSVTKAMKGGDTVSGIIADLVSQDKLSRRQIQASLLDLMGASVDTVSDRLCGRARTSYFYNIVYLFHQIFVENQCLASFRPVQFLRF